MNIKRIALGCAVVSMLLTGCGSNDTGQPVSIAKPTLPKVAKVGVGSIPYPPFSAPDASGAWVGFDIDLQRAVCEVEQMRCEVVIVPWESLFQALKDRRIDVIWTSMMITPEREAIVDFTDMYYDLHNVLIGAAADGTVASLENAGSLRGKAVGVQKDTLNAAFIAKYFGGVAEVREYDTLDAALTDLRAGRLNYVSDIALSLTPFLESNPSFTIKTTWPMDPIFGSGVAAAVREGDQALREKLNAGLADVVRSGRYDEILRAYPELVVAVRKPEY